MVCAVLASFFQSDQLLAHIIGHTFAMSEMIKLHIAAGMIHSRYLAWITYCSLDTLLRGQVAAVNAAKANLMKMQTILSTGSRLVQVTRGRAKYFNLLTHKDV